MDEQLNWPIEGAQGSSTTGYQWNQAGSNICLDFHGDPLAAKLVVFSDGNHHMALQACCQAFLKSNPNVNDVFYATTPPRVILESVLQGGAILGNLRLNILPHVFISPENILNNSLRKNSFHHIKLLRVAAAMSYSSKKAIQNLFLASLIYYVMMFASRYQILSLKQQAMKFINRPCSRLLQSKI